MVSSSTSHDFKDALIPCRSCHVSDRNLKFCHSIDTYCTGTYMMCCQNIFLGWNTIRSLIRVSVIVIKVVSKATVLSNAVSMKHGTANRRCNMILLIYLGECQKTSSGSLATVD